MSILRVSESLSRGVEGLIEAMAERHGVEASVEQLAESPIINLSTKVINVIEHAAIEKGILYKKMNSGAVHEFGHARRHNRCRYDFPAQLRWQEPCA